MLQFPSDTLPFHSVEGAGQAWPSAAACDVGGSGPTDTRDEGESAGQLLRSWAGPFIPLQSALMVPPTSLQPACPAQGPATCLFPFNSALVTHS